MVYLDLIFNLSLLVALSVVSGFLDKRFARDTRTGALLQGALFGAVAIVGMLRPLTLGPGLIFDGRSVMLSLCALFFGPLAAAVSCVMALACRISIGGAGLIMGILTSLSSTAIGLIFFYRDKPSLHPPSAKLLYMMGLSVHAALVALMFTLPGNLFWSTFKNLALPIIALFPLATLLAGKILSDHLSMMQSAAALSESEERYRLLFEASLDAVMLTAPDGRILSANPAACRLLGRSEEELIAVGRDGIMDREDPRLAGALAERERTGMFSGELTMIHKDGAKIPVEITTAIFEDRCGQARTSMIIRDITRRLREEESLKKLQALLTETQKLSKIGGWEIDLTTGQGQWTDEVYKIHGIPPDRLPGNEEAINFYAPEDRPVITAAFRRLLETGEPYDLELRLNKATGESLRVRTIGQAEWRGGKIVRVFGNIMDITERKEIESRQMRLLDILDSSLNEIYIIDAETLCFEYVNQGALNNIGFSMEEMKRMTPLDINPHLSEQTFRDMLAQLKAGKVKQHVFEAAHRRKDQSVYPVEVYLQPHSGADHDIFFAVINDISERKAVEARILKINEELEQKVQARTAELNKTIRQLEETNRVFVGRELKMAQLKKRIEELEEKWQNTDNT
jgi:PAS domain S-box-containing protein